MNESTIRAFVAEHEAGVPSGVRAIEVAELGDDGVLIEVEFSSLNFKDGLASRPDGKVARRSPLIVGVDLAGTVVESADPRFAAGDRVLAHGYELGVSHHGGLAERARVPADWVVRLPDGLDARGAMVLGTAGYTAALSVLALEGRGLEPGSAPVLVTGATGGVGSTAVAILAARGHDVHASTGKPDAADWLRSLGAAEVLGRAEVEAHAERPLSKALWAGVIDSCGGRTLAGALAATAYGGAVAASGLTGGAKLETTVMPFILRAVALLGIESGFTPIGERQAVWDALATSHRPRDLDALVLDEIGLEGVEHGLATLLAGGARGRYVVALR